MKLGSTDKEATERLSKAMGDLSLQNVEIDKLKEKLQRMEETKNKLDNAYIVEIKKNFKLTKQIKKYSNESLTIKTLFEAKENI